MGARKGRKGTICGARKGRRGAIWGWERKEREPYRAERIGEERGGTGIDRRGVKLCWERGKGAEHSREKWRGARRVRKEREGVGGTRNGIGEGREGHDHSLQDHSSPLMGNSALRQRLWRSQKG